ncbi:MAG: FAD-dependent oxidoreductase [Deltaproteobacteria bacterium]|nr:FAD-dependent oxidoreductase [Deltaproteobacteria bacterium]
MKVKYQIIIVGSGFAGLGAAKIVSDHGLDILIIDENIHLGGQLLRNIEEKPGNGGWIERDRLESSGYHIIEQIYKRNTSFMKRTQVLGIFPERCICVEDSKGHISELKSDYILCATGARERFLPFKGWTLPGVISTGAAQILIKSAGVLPAREILIGGSGPLSLALASEVLDNKGRVISVLDQNSLSENLRILYVLHRQIPKLMQGAHYLARLLGAHVPFRSKVGIVEARGSRHLEEVITAKLYSNGTAIHGTEKIYSTRSLAVGYGFVPNIELPQIAGCELTYSEDMGGWVVAVDRFMETSVKGIFAAGEVTGIAGAKKSYIEGQIAGLTILHNVGFIKDAIFEQRVNILSRQRQYELQFGKFLNRLSQPPSGIFETISDDTIICRCEDVNMGEIRRQISNGFMSIDSIKMTTRCGMGNCQGRICGPILSDIIAECAKKPKSQIPPVSVRFPVKATRLNSLGNIE